MKKISATVISALFVLCPLHAQNRSFAIIVDKESHARCGREIEAYRRAVCDQGLNAYTLAEEWASPEQVRDSILYYHEHKALEGVVLVGDIPIPMIRGAQHMASAFKMDEDGDFSMRESSIPSDRFYDDFDLKFDFISRDSTERSFFYYRLRSDSAQEIKSDIYSARIKPSADRGDRYAELAAYLEKAVRVKKERNEADRIVSYTGAGSFSNSLIAWKDETELIAQQFPKTSLSESGAKFFVFAMHDYPKDIMIPEIKDDDNDIVLFHEHGLPERQYLSEIPPARETEDLYRLGRQKLRNRFATRIRYGDSPETLKKSLEGLSIDSTWFEQAINPSREDIVKDSLDDLHTGMILDDIQEAKPNARLIVLDACYNGDFRESDCIAARYIFAGGNTVAAIGNTVNVLQDKSSADMMGMLSCGYSIGEWMKECNNIESHIHGDPTFRFAPSWDGDRPDLNSTSPEYWKKYLSDEYPCDIQSLALNRLFDIGCEGLSQIILDTYKHSPYYMVRLQCLTLCAHFADGSYTELLKLAADDPYEFIRRKTAYFIGKTGVPELAETLANIYLNDYNAHRIMFNITQSMGYFEKDVITEAFRNVIGSATWLYDRDSFLEDALNKIESAQYMYDRMKGIVRNSSGKLSKRARIALSKNIRNNPYPLLAEDIINVVMDQDEDPAFRVNCAEYLGWFVRSAGRIDIIRELRSYVDGADDIPAALEQEIEKTVIRLSEYSRL